MCAVVPIAHPAIFGLQTSVELSLKWETRRYRRGELEDIRQ